ncbi:MAG: Crp/Fnr family transcriptional regulator [Desulfobacteraceae bacterium]|nr:Crp/Fnr family transcriptional regulator [Desulfobacteraceae bacterium]
MMLETLGPTNPPPHRPALPGLDGVAPQIREAILARGQRNRVPSGQPLYRQGSPARRCYLVASGRLKLVKLHEQGKEAVFRYIGPGEITAVVAVFKEKAYPLTAVAIGDTQVVGWDRPTFMALLREYPELALHLLQVAVERLDEVQTRYLELNAEQVQQRLARALLRIMKHSGRRTPDGILIDFPLSRQELADYTGTTLYTVSRTLSAWEKNGWVASGRERITVTDPHTLVKFSETGETD